MARIHMHRGSSRNQEISQVIARIQAGVLAAVCALVGGMGLFLMTAWLLIQNGPNTGQHLGLLGAYFIGYTVTWPGSMVGFFYGALLGGLIGWTIGTVYNRMVGLRFR